MTDQIRFQHRQPPAGWTESTSDIAGCLRGPVESARCLVQEIFEVSVNLSIKDAPAEHEVEGLIHKSDIVMDQLGDISEMLDELQKTG